MTGFVIRVRSVYWSILNFNSGSSTSHADRQYFLKENSSMLHVIFKKNQRTNGPVNAHLISGPRISNDVRQRS